MEKLACVFNLPEDICVEFVNYLDFPSKFNLAATCQFLRPVLYNTNETRLARTCAGLNITHIDTMWYVFDNSYQVQRLVCDGLNMGPSRCIDYTGSIMCTFAGKTMLMWVESGFSSIIVSLVPNCGIALPTASKYRLRFCELIFNAISRVNTYIDMGRTSTIGQLVTEVLSSQHMCISNVIMNPSWLFDMLRHQEQQFARG